jgi:hypothetical protein
LQNSSPFHSSSRASPAHFWSVPGDLFVFALDFAFPFAVVFPFVGVAVDFVFEACQDEGSMECK